MLVNDSGKVLVGSDGKVATDECPDTCCGATGACCHPVDCDPDTHRYVCTVESELHCTDSIDNGGLAGTYLGNGTECTPISHCCPCVNVLLTLNASFTVTPPFAPPDCVLSGGFSISGELLPGHFGSPCIFYSEFNISGWSCGGSFNEDPASFVHVYYVSSPIGDPTEDVIHIEVNPSCDGGCNGFNRIFEISVSDPDSDPLDIPSSFSVTFSGGGNTESYSGTLSFA